MASKRSPWMASPVIRLAPGNGKEHSEPRARVVSSLGRGLDYFIENTFNYPTLAEAYKIAALDAWNRMPR